MAAFADLDIPSRRIFAPRNVQTCGRVSSYAYILPQTTIRIARAVERATRERGLDMAALAIDELEVLWQEAKLEEE